jgi:vancomycin resistance protein YoaR
VITALVVVLALWALDYRSLGDRVARNSTVENVDIGRLDGAALHQAMARADKVYGTGTVEFLIAGKPHPLSAAEIGLRLDESATITSARRIGRNDPMFVRPITWAASFFAPRRVEVRVSLDRAKLAVALAKLPGQVPVTEPRVVGSAESVGTTAGKGGYGFDPARVAGQIESVARDGTMPIRVTLVPRPIAPKVSDEAAQALAQQARLLTDKTMMIDVPGRTMSAGPATLRSWITSVVPPGSSTARLAFDAARVRHDVEEQIGGAVRKPLDATFTVQGSQVILVPQVNGSVCCSVATGAKVFAALRAGDAHVRAPLTVEKPKFTTEDARKLGITTLLGSGQDAASEVTSAPPAPLQDGTTTTRPGGSATTASTTTTTLPNGGGPGQFIVPIPAGIGVAANVQHAIPFIRGRIIMPGKSLSLHSVLGAPSPDNGYAPAVVDTADGPSWISGGGNDLVAAALFQAAFYGGLDIPTSTRHDVALPGVPLGIEATLRWPEPDLVIRNPSSHAVLIWVDLARGGVRVQLFSTPFTASVGSSQKVVPYGPDGACRAVTTTRTRTFSDGRRATDTFSARYTPPPAARDDPDRVICPN